MKSKIAATKLRSAGLMLCVASSILSGVLPPAHSAPSQPNLPHARFVMTPDSKAMSDILAKQGGPLLSQQYDVLEKTAREYRNSKEVAPTGQWKLGLFYEGTIFGIVGPDKSSLFTVGLLRGWAEKRPQSITAQVALANALVRYAWRVRGGLMREATEEEMKIFHEHLTEARLVLREAKKLPDKCPYWWVVAQRIAQAQEWDKKTYEGLFAEAIQFEPAFDEYYFEKAGFLHVNGDRSKQEWEKYALALADQIGGEKGDILYARMVWYMARQRFISGRYSNFAISFQRLDRGFEALLKAHPDSLLVMNAWAYLTSIVGTQEFVERRKARNRELFPKIGANADSSVWPSVGTFEETRRNTFDIPDYQALAFEKSQQGDYKGAVADLDAAIKMFPRRGELYTLRGNAKSNLNQYKEALPDYDRATDLEPNNAYHYSNRSNAQAKLGNWKAALADANRAIQIDPGHMLAHLNRAAARQGSGDVQGAMADFDTAIQLTPDFFWPYYWRGRGKVLLRDFQGAIEDFTEAIKLEPKARQPYSARGFAHYNLQMWPESLSDFRQFLSVARPTTDTNYQRFYIWIIRTRMGEVAAATQELTAFLDKQNEPEKWENKIGAFLIGKMPEPQFLAAADDKDPTRMKEKQTEAFFYVGIKHLIAGEKQQATEYFQKTVDLKVTSFNETQAAEAELKALQAQQ